MLLSLPVLLLVASCSIASAWRVSPAVRRGLAAGASALAVWWGQGPGDERSFAANLPETNGASLTKTGTNEALKPILDLRAALQKVAQVKDVEAIATLLSSAAPTDERSFKRLFDEYSNPISYKQNYLDKNAFVVYYTAGFDGPGRQSIETLTPSETKQKDQYYYRNEAWIAIEDARSEAAFILANPIESRADLDVALQKALASVSAYIDL